MIWQTPMRLLRTSRYAAWRQATASQVCQFMRASPRKKTSLERGLRSTLVLTASDSNQRLDRPRVRAQQLGDVAPRAASRICRSRSLTTLGADNCALIPSGRVVSPPREEDTNERSPAMRRFVQRSMTPLRPPGDGDLQREQESRGALETGPEEVDQPKSAKEPEMKTVIALALVTLFACMRSLRSP